MKKKKEIWKRSQRTPLYSAKIVACLHEEKKKKTKKKIDIFETQKNSFGLKNQKKSDRQNYINAKPSKTFKDLHRPSKTLKDLQRPSDEP